MGLSLRPLHPVFGAEVHGLDLRDDLDDATLERLRLALHQHAVLLWLNQPLTDEVQCRFAERLGGELQRQTGKASLTTGIGVRLGGVPLSDISNLDENNRILAAEDERRIYSLANRLWHTDASFKQPPARYSMLSARSVPPDGGETEYADMRAAYDSLPEAMKREIDGLTAHHCIAYSKGQIGFPFTEEQLTTLPNSNHPLVHVHPGSKRKALYIGAHVGRIVGWPVAESTLLLRELVELATLPHLVYRHHWSVNDFVIWDNRATMHRGRAYDDAKYPRDMRRATTMDAERTDGLPVAPSERVLA